MGLRKALGIVVFTTQAVVAVDYNMQSQKAGLSPGELSMKTYAEIVQNRYDKQDVTDLVTADNAVDGVDANRAETDGLWRKVTGFSAGLAAQLTGEQELATAGAEAPVEAPPQVCIRRGTALNCQ